MNATSSHRYSIYQLLRELDGHAIICVLRPTDSTDRTNWKLLRFEDVENGIIPIKELDGPVYNAVVLRDGGTTYINFEGGILFIPSKMESSGKLAQLNLFSHWGIQDILFEPIPTPSSYVLQESDERTASLMFSIKDTALVV